MAVYKIYVRDQNFNKVAEIDDYASLEMVSRFNAVGAWTMEIHTNTAAARELVKPRAGIIVKRDGITVFSGPVTQRKRKWDISTDQLTLSGLDDNVWLSRYLALPVTSGPPYTTADYDVKTGPVETVMKAYVTANMGSGAKADRQLNITIEPDRARGTTVTGRARFCTLLDLFSTLALAGGDIGFRIVQAGNGLQFFVYQPADKTASAVFSPALGNLLSFEYSDADPDANYIIVGGNGDGTARTFVESGDPGSIAAYGRIEEFLDNRNTSNVSELNQAIIAELAQKAQKTSLTITPVDTESIAFGQDYSLGDRVSVILTQQNEAGGQDVLDTIQDVVREVRFKITTDGEVITPFIGTPDTLSHPIMGIFRKMKQLNNRVSNIERR